MDKMDSKDVAAAAIRMSISETMEMEKELKGQLLTIGIHAAAVNFGGDFLTSVNKIIERAVVAAKREGVIGASRSEEGAVAGAAREAVSQITTKAIGLNVGGKIGIARSGDHVSVAMYFVIGLLNMNEISIGLGHRMI